MISSVTNRVVYNPNGSTSEFAVPFYFIEDSHIYVVRTDVDGTEVVMVLDDNYTLTGAGDEGGGTLTFGLAWIPIAGTILSISRVVPITQLVDYVPNTNFPAATHEQALDRLTMICQYLADLVARSLKYPTSETNDANYQLPASTQRLNTLVGFDASGNLYLYTIDPVALSLIAPVLVDTAQLANGSVTEPKLATSLDLSAHSVILPFASIGGEQIKTLFNLTGKQVVLPENCIVSKNFLGRPIISDVVAQYMQMTRLTINNPDVGLIITSAGTAAVNQVYSKLDTYNTKNRYISADANIHLRWNSGSSVWEIYNIGSASVVYVSNDGNTAHTWSTPDQVRLWTTVTGVNPTPSFSFNCKDLEVVGTVKATAFEGDATSLSNVPLEPYATILYVPDMTGGCQRASDRATYFINKKGQVLAAGLNTNGKLGLGNTSPANVAYPRKSYFVVGADAIDNVTDNLNDGTDTVVKIVLRDNNAFALTASGILYAAGINSSGQCGQGNTTQCAVFKSMRFGATAASNKRIVSFSIADGQSNGCHCLAIDIDGQVWVWGENAHGQLGINNTTNQTTPVKLSTSSAVNAATFVSKVATQVLAILGDRGSSYLLFNDGTAYASGRNQYGQLGQGNTTDLPNFALIGAFTTIQQLYGGGHFGGGGTQARGNLYVRLADNTIYGCGNNASGQLGVGDTTQRTSLTVVTGLGAVLQFYVMGDYDKWCLAVKSDGTVKTWGENFDGQLGIGSTTDSTSAASPTGVDALATANDGITKVVGVGNTTHADTFILFGNGKVYGCGGNNNGQLALGHATTPSNVFTRTGLGSPDTVDIVAASLNDQGNCLAMRANGTLFGSGYNGSQHMATGDNSTADLWVATKYQV